MIKMLWLFYFLISFALHVTGQELVELLTLHDHSTPEAQEVQFHTAALVPNEHLKKVSSGILMAESWTRTHVLAHYPAINITSIVVGHTLLCEKSQADDLSLILPSLKNIHYTLTRWGLHKEIKVSASFSSSCVPPNSVTFRSDISETHIKPLLSFLQDINSPYLLNPPSHLPTLSDKTKILLKSHTEAMKNLGFFNLKKILVIIKDVKEPKPTSRKLSFILDNSKTIQPFPARPTPLAPTNAPVGYSAPSYAAKSPLPPWLGKVSSPPLSLPFAPELPPMINPANPPYGLHLPHRPTPLAPTNAPVGSSAPSYAAKSPLPPWLGKVSSPPLSLPFAPELPPMINPANPPYGLHLPPCNPSHGGGGGGGAVPSVKRGLWCVAKPSVPPETLQEALNYACGEGGADCEAIRSRGSCYYPNTVVNHASYAFNSYWQKTKSSGGSCGFGGTAMLIDSDPSYRHCRYTLA